MRRPRALPPTPLQHLSTMLWLSCAFPSSLIVPTKQISPGVHMPSISMGTWLAAGGQHPENASLIVDNWLQLGGRGIDTALVYLDQADVASSIAASGVPRSNLFITSKIPACIGHALAKVAVEKDLQELNTTYIDLMLIHSPIGLDCPGTWHALEEA